VISVINTILSLFAVIFLGTFARKRGLITPQLLGPLNKLVFYVAIPSLLFREISKAPFHQYFDSHLVEGLLLPPVFVFFASVGLGRFLGVKGSRLGTFVQASIHGNLGYMGLAVAYYALGQEGFTRAGLLASFLILVQNFLSILGLQLCSGGRGRIWDLAYFLKNLLLNPIILACLGGIFASAWAIKLPALVSNVLNILSGMALPVALLLIGASLSFTSSWKDMPVAIVSSFFKLMLVPALGVFIYSWLRLDGSYVLPSIILLASPTATVTYVMARELNGEPAMATTTISISTLLSGLTYFGWLVYYH